MLILKYCAGPIFSSVYPACQPLLTLPARKQLEQTRTRRVLLEPATLAFTG